MIYGIIDQNACVNILSDVLLSYSYYNMPLKWKFQQNNDPKRRSKSVKNRFTQNRIDAMPWPAQSSDLSPIENLWGDIKQNVSKNSPTSKAQIWQVVQDALINVFKRKTKLVLGQVEFCY